MKTLCIDFGDRGSRRFVDQVCEGLSGPGFIQLRRHGIPIELREQAADLLRRVMAFPEEELRALARPELYYQRGYGPYRAEVAVDGASWDLKRYWMVREPEMPVLLADCPFGPNVWVPQVPDFERVMTDLYDKIMECIRWVLLALEQAFGLPTGAMLAASRGAESFLRPIQYDPLDFYPDRRPNQVRSFEHFDINALTALIGAKRPSVHESRSTLSDLELYIDGAWIRLEVEPDVLIIDNGEQIGLFPGMPEGALPATRHRVRNPDDPASTRRIFALFQHWLRSQRLRDGRTSGQALDERIAILTGKR